MKRICLLSDTHSFLDPKIKKYASSCDEIWHAGDIGVISVADELNKMKPLKAVYGNIDGHIARRAFPKTLIFNCEEMKILITHIGGYPGRYSKDVKAELEKERPDIFICGHSHILKVIYDNKLNLLHLNPGACGNHGFHKVKTLLRFTIDGKKIQDMEVVELGNRGII